MSQAFRLLYLELKSDKQIIIFIRVPLPLPPAPRPHQRRASSWVLEVIKSFSGHHTSQKSKHFKRDLISKGDGPYKPSAFDEILVYFFCTFYLNLTKKLPFKLKFTPCSGEPLPGLCRVKDVRSLNVHHNRLYIFWVFQGVLGIFWFQHNFNSSVNIHYSIKNHN